MCNMEAALKLEFIRAISAFSHEGLSLYAPTSLAVDPDEAVYVVDHPAAANEPCVPGHLPGRLQRISPAGVITSVPLEDSPADLVKYLPDGRLLVVSFGWSSSASPFLNAMIVGEGMQMERRFPLGPFVADVAVHDDRLIVLRRREGVLLGGRREWHLLDCFDLEGRRADERPPVLAAIEETLPADFDGATLLVLSDGSMLIDCRYFFLPDGRLAFRFAEEERGGDIPLVAEDDSIFFISAEGELFRLIPGTHGYAESPLQCSRQIRPGRYALFNAVRNGMLHLLNKECSCIELYGMSPGISSS